MSVDNKYDAIIIGAGIGGLTCGTYLAKKGMKTLIVERHHTVGGYCGSFKRKNFVFDIGIHSLPDCGEYGRIPKVLKELDINNDVEILRTKINDIVISPDYKIEFQTKVDDIKDVLTKNFKKESKGINEFINFLMSKSFIEIYAELYNKPFSCLLEKYFKDEKLKSILKAFLGNLGLPSHLASGVTSAILYRDHLLNGGYYVKGGMQNLSNKVANKFVEYGGKLMLSNEVKTIVVKKGLATGIVLESGAEKFGRYIISNGDMRNTYLTLLKTKVSQKTKRNVNKLMPASSAFVVYMGFKGKLSDNFNIFSGLWYMNNYKVDKFYDDITKTKVDEKAQHIFLSSPSMKDESLAPRGKESLFLTLWAPYKSKKYWEDSKNKITQNMIEQINKIIPNFKDKIEFFEDASPQTFEKYTLNYKGSIRGWSQGIQNKFNEVVSIQSKIENLFFVGHWVVKNAPGGISMAMTSGYNVAKLILKKAGGL